jgi:hypothetical protein
MGGRTSSGRRIRNEGAMCGVEGTSGLDRGFGDGMSWQGIEGRMRFAMP